MTPILVCMYVLFFLTAGMRSLRYIFILSDAIDAELQGHYADAVNLFVEAHDSYKEEVDPEEVNLWMQEMLRCYEQLTEWQDMGAYVNGKFEGNFDAIWSDTEKV